MSTPMRVRVAASTANLGSGYDTLGMALSLYDTIYVSATEHITAEVTVEGPGAGRVPQDGRHLVVRVIRETLRSLGVESPGLWLRCHNAIPHSRGLGSSAAAIVAGVAAGYELAGMKLRDNAAQALQLAASYEGHADNVAASLFGGLVIAWQEAERFRAVRLDPHVELRPVALVPQTESSTRTTRGLLPERVSHADAAFAAGRSALAVHALSHDPSLLLAATEDRLHQDYREPAWPGTIRLVCRLRELGIPAAVSGAGPTVIAMPSSGELPAELDTSGFTALSLRPEYDGVRVDHAWPDVG